MELWKKVEGYESYEISNTGKVLTHNWMNRGITKVMCPSKYRGYFQVNLWKNGKQKCMRVHRLVADAFIPNPDNLKEINHIDGNKENNHVSNLEWCTREHNLKHSTENMLNINFIKGLKRHAESISKPIVAIEKKTGMTYEFVSIQEAARMLMVPATKVCACAKGRIKSANGYIFRYKEME